MSQNRIKEVIKEKGYSITTLAEKMGIYRESLSRMLNSPSYPTLENLSKALDVPIWQFFASPEEIKSDGNTLVCPHCGKPINIELKK